MSRPDSKTRQVDRHFVFDVLENLKRSGFPATEGYFLVVMSELEVRELRLSLAHEEERMVAEAPRHPPPMLAETMRNIGMRWALTLGSAVVCYPDPERQPDRRGQQRPRPRLRIVN